MSSRPAVRVLFVCAGNTCRSPMAAGLAKAMFRGTAIVRSAGIDCESGRRAADNAVEVMAERGVDISAHRSTNAGDLDIREFDVVVALSPEIGQRLQGLHPRCLEHWQVSDPYGGDMATYRRAADAIEAALRTLAWST